MSDANVSSGPANASPPPQTALRHPPRAPDTSANSRKNLWIAAAAAGITLALGVTTGAALGVVRTSAGPDTRSEQPISPTSTDMQSGRSDADPLLAAGAREDPAVREDPGVRSEERRSSWGRDDDDRHERGESRRRHHEEEDDDD